MVFSKLTSGETLFLKRRRNNDTRMDVAKKYNLMVEAITCFEEDRISFPGIGGAITFPTLGEQCLILRKRLQWNLPKTISELGLPALTILQYEYDIGQTTEIESYRDLLFGAYRTEGNGRR